VKEKQTERVKMRVMWGGVEYNILSGLRIFVFVAVPYVIGRLFDNALSLDVVTIVAFGLVGGFTGRMDVL